MDGAAANGHLGIVKFLHEDHSEGCTTNAMDDVAAKENFEMVKFLHENHSEGCTRGAVNGGASFFLNQQQSSALNGLVRSIECGSSYYPSAYISMNLICRLSTKFCLFEAREIAWERNLTEMVELLNGFIAEDVRSCSLHLHSRSGPRRYQKKTREPW